ncbi:nitroreductase [Nocardia farcinica]|uniref:nitroreductase n=1 Tax=Nocardia farcinica TaxID=37329 RepID=UPI0015F043A5|nr:nitroreductase [Nocardia farcinica]MBA4855217.1 nitroreductase [Nocardia farcinica]MBC9817788.1 nitroreductase [Nocardia farcinica]MBF6420801.1 nitroreductase [Nocardia farcinica]MBF6432045.1 nitroreductase [Nocardia farcinica]MBF6502755.1 nitroreductase [Nocardia farcinica]
MSPTSTPTAEQAALARILDGRYTCRQFRPDPVPRATIETLLRMAQRTPSWCNTQPWQVVVTEPAATDRFRKELLEHIQTATPAPDLPFPGQYTGAYRDRRRECGKQLYESVGIARGDNAGSMRQMLRNFELFDAPHVAIVTTEAELGVYGAVDSGLYIGTFLLAAQSLGLGAAPQAALAGYSPFLRSHFGIPEHRQVVAGISFGYADTEHPANSFRTTRADLDQVVTFVD